MATLLEEPLLVETLRALPGWHVEGTEIAREVHLASREDAQLRHDVDVASESMGHPPSVETVTGGTRFALRTPELGGVSEIDIVMASRISDLAHRLDKREPGIRAVRADEVAITDEANDIGPDDPRALLGRR